jgi:adenylate cyclase
MTAPSISVLLADDNLIVREGVKALLDLEDDFDIVGVAADYDDLVGKADETRPQVVVTDIRMPPNYLREGIDAALEIRKRNPGTGVVILSQYDDPEYAVSLLSGGAAGYAYLLKDRVGEGDQLAQAVREVAIGGSMLDSKIVEGLTTPVRKDAALSTAEEKLLRQVAGGRSIKTIAVTGGTTPEHVDSAIEQLFTKLARGLSTGNTDSLARLKRLYQAIVEREELGETLARLLPGGIAERLRRGGQQIGTCEELDVTVLMTDIRGYTTIAEHTEPSVLAGQLNEHRTALNQAILSSGGTIMQFVGDAVIAVFGAPIPQDDHAQRAVDAAAAIHAAQAELNETWASEAKEPFGLGIGLSTGVVAAALLGSEERLEYTVIGDTVNLTQRVQQWAEAGETVMTRATWKACTRPIDVDELAPALVKGRDAPVAAYRFPRRR